MRVLLLLTLICGALAAHSIYADKFKNPYKTVVVAADGSGNYKNVMDAVNDVPNGNTDWFEILVKPGTYNQHVIIPATKTFIKLVGDGSVESVILSYDITTSTPNTSYTTSGAFVILSDDFYAQGISFVNTHGEGTQAIALSLAGNRQQFEGCIVKGYQDTLYAQDGVQYFHNSTIYGAVDFIYGGSTMLLDKCTVVNVAGGAVTAARTPQDVKYGIVFLGCTITAEKTVAAGSTYLGRTWGPYAAVDFLNCYEGAHIASVGWNNMGNPSYQPTVRLGEYQNNGPGSSTKDRVTWSHQLTSSEAATYTEKDILGSWTPL